ncbi:MAG: hypothetical protein U1E31_03250 [Rickettsiales bacterium]
MDLLEEVISDDKFERNTKFFKKIIFVSIFIGIVLIIYSIYTNKKQKQELKYNTELTQVILNNKIDFNNFEDKKIDQIVKFNIIKNKLMQYQKKYFDINKLNSDELSIQQIKFYNEIYVKLQEFIDNKNDLILSNIAKNYLGNLMLDMPKLFKKEDIYKYFNNLAQDDKNLNNQEIILKALWLKDNASEQENLDYLNKYIKLLEQKKKIYDDKYENIRERKEFYTKEYFINQAEAKIVSNILDVLWYYKKLYEY